MPYNEFVFLIEDWLEDNKKQEEEHKKQKAREEAESRKQTSSYKQPKVPKMGR